MRGLAAGGSAVAGRAAGAGLLDWRVAHGAGRAGRGGGVHHAPPWVAAVDGTREGLAAAKARGRVGGRPTVVTPDLLRAARDMLPNPEHSVISIAKLLGVSPGTLYNHIPNLRELRVARRPAELETGSR